MRSINWRHFDFWLFGVVVLLVIFGLAMIRSAVAGSPGLADSVTRQMVFVIMGIVVMILVAMLDYHYWASIIRPIYLITFILLVVVFAVSKARFGAARWLETGLVSIQPAELGKIVVILALAEFFAHTRDKPHDIRWIIQSLLIPGGLVVWIVLQPNLSTTIVILVLWLALIWLSGLKLKYMAIFAATLLVAAPLIFPFLAQYQQKRIIQFIAPDPNATYGDTYNINQARITLGSGGWFGMGYGHGTQVQLRFLKARQTDFIFASIAEEFGFVGATILLLLIFFVVLRCLKAARQANDLYGSLIAYGFATLIAFQTAVNVGVNLGLLPVTGLTLPFISYGGSSLLSMVLGIGLVESVILRQKPLDF
jgi:rod shape determining protein RodA